MFIVKPPVKIVATILAKNEEDIIASTIEHHLKQGVWKIIFTDNNSTDNTKKIAESYPEVAEIIDEPGQDHNQSAWVTKMAQIACKLKPDWIVHLDADEHWEGLRGLSGVTEQAVSCDRMYLHPPVNWQFDLKEMSPYLDFDEIPIPQESKVAHRPDPDIVITHGNHGIEGLTLSSCKSMWRHHYPIRSFEQWKRKSEGHEALQKRGAVCERWKMWNDFLKNNTIEKQYELIITSWKSMIKSPNKTDFLNLLQFWATKEMQQFFEQSDLMPKIRFN